MNVKKFIIIIVIIICALTLTYFIYKMNTRQLYIIEKGGGFESAYVTWNDNEKIESYNVYIKNVNEDNYKQIDTELIRKYKKDNKYYWRADVVGLEQGEYILKIEPVSSMIILPVTTKKISVKSNIREGFSFSRNSTNGGNSSGGYLENGQAQDDAKIVYICKENVNTIKLEITNNNNEKIEAIGLCDILQKWKEEAISKHLIIRIIGKIDRQDVNGLESENISILINECNNVTIEGIGNDATLNGIGILLLNSSNIEIRNLGFMFFYEDAIGIEKDNNNIWIHNNDFFYGEERENNDTGENKFKGDGSVDIKASKYITISYNHFYDSGKTSLCGLIDDLDYITYHHNWFDHSDQRLPRVRYASVHIYNNYYDSCSKYCIGASMNASIFAEENVFKDCNSPILISSQGSDVPSLKMSGEDGGMIKAYNNLFKGKNKETVYANEDAIQFDAYLANSREEKVPEEYKCFQGNYIYNNFDTNSEIMYNYIPDEPSNVQEVVTKNSGRLQGGDIKFDTSILSKDSYVRVTRKERELDDFIKSYESSLVYVQLKNNY